MKPGDLLECVDSVGVDYLRKGARYIAVYVYGEFVDVGIVHNGQLPGFYQRRFRCIPSIEIFTAMLNPQETVNGQKDPCKVEG